MSYIYGVSPVLEALRAGKRNIHRIIFARGGQPARLEEIRQLARRNGVTCVEEPRERLNQLAANANHQGVIAVVAAANYADPHDLLEAVTGIPLLVLLDQVEDPHNLGAIVRTAECSGAQGVFVTEHHAAGLTETVVKASAGATEHLPVARVTNLSSFIERLKGRGIWVVGVEKGGSKRYTEWDFTTPTAIVLGSEGKGMRRLVREHCDLIVSIPLAGQISSLNVSVAAGVVLYEAFRQRSFRRDKETI